jgi:hypothetical protein
LPTSLDQPESDDDLYLGIGADVDPFRPLLQGDVYAGLSIAGYPSGDHDHVAVLQHPCSMRRGPELRARVAVVPVRAYQRVASNAWPSGHTRVVPLPTVSVGPNPHSSAFLAEPGTVAAGAFAQATRVAQLSTRGLLLFQQRLIYCSTHCVVGLDTLEEFAAPALAEAELLADWCTALAEGHPDIPEPAAIQLESAAFERYIRIDTNVQMRLDAVDTRSDARRQVRVEIERRVQAIRERGAQEGADQERHPADEG